MVTRSLGIKPSLYLIKEDRIPVEGYPGTILSLYTGLFRRNGARNRIGMLAFFPSERWSFSRRNGGRIQPEYAVIEVMQEKGYDLQEKTTQTTLNLLKQGKSYDIIITVCSKKASEQCPIFPGRALRRNWPFDDPSKIEGDKDAKLIAIRRIRDQIEEKIKEFIQQYNEKGLKIFL